jgi:hypothetical protein
MADEDDPTLRYFDRIDGAHATASPMSLRSLSADDQAYAVLYACNGLIGNGGFAGLFQNPSGNIAGLLPLAAERLQLPKQREIAQKALSIFGSDYPDDFDVRWPRWEQLCDQLEDELDARLEPLDAQWYAAEEELEQALLVHAQNRL